MKIKIPVDTSILMLDTGDAEQVDVLEMKEDNAQYNPQDYYENVSTKLIGTGI